MLPGGRVVRVMHTGPYETMEQTCATLQTWMAEQGLQPATGMWESYLSDPWAEPDPATWRTLIVWPVA
ncbi:MAG: GyrI-like domain-containing protein [Acidimicrobiales bacterium]